MNCTQAQERFAELLDSRLSESDTDTVRAHLAACPDCQRDYSSLAQTLSALDKLPATKPSPRLRANFYASLEEEKNSATSIRAAVARRHRASRISLWTWVLSPIAAIAIALAGFHLGTQYGAASSVPPVAAAPADDADMKRELAELRAKVDSVGQLVGFSLLQQRSTSERLQSVLSTLDNKTPDQKVIGNLIGALALDPSVNVRLSALDALFPHADQQLVRTGVHASLPREPNPLVQVAMIDFLVAARDREATPELQKMARDESIDRQVREAAKRGLAQL